MAGSFEHGQSLGGHAHAARGGGAFSHLMAATNPGISRA